MSRTLSKILQIPSPTDGSLRRLLVALFAEQTISRADVKIGAGTMRTIEGVVIPDSDSGDGPEPRSMEDVVADLDVVLNSTTESSVTIREVKFYRGNALFCAFERVRTVPIELTQNNRGTIQYHSSPDYRVAEFYFEREGGEGSSEFNAALAKVVRPATGDDGGDGGPDGLNAVLSRMTAVTAGMMEDLAKSQLVQEQRMAALMEEQKVELEERKKQLDAAHKVQLDELDKRNDQLNAREEELDNATARSTRRKLRGDITSALKENQEQEIIPESVRKVRKPILWIAGVGILAPILFSAWAFWQVTKIPAGLSGAALNWYLGSLLLRGSLGVAAAVAVGLYLLKYLRNIEAEAGRRALSLEQNLFDIDRASWVIETVMELKEEEGMTSVPGPWLTGVTRGLFQYHKEDEAERGPVDALVGLMGSGMALKLNNGDSEVSFDPKASRAAAKKQLKTESTDG